MRTQLTLLISISLYTVQFHHMTIVLLRGTGANLLARALKPIGGIVMWRAFVCVQSPSLSTLLPVRSLALSLRVARYWVKLPLTLGDILTKYL